jgi:hypothetical protein
MILSKIVFSCDSCFYYQRDSKESCKFADKNLKLLISEECPLIKARSFEGRFSKTKTYLEILNF